MNSCTKRQGHTVVTVMAGSKVHGGPVKLLNGKAGAGQRCMRR
jgi:hypothetical protein